MVPLANKDHGLSDAEYNAAESLVQLLTGIFHELFSCLYLWHDSVKGRDRDKAHSYNSSESGLFLYYYLFYDSVTKPVNVVNPESVLAMEIITTTLADVLLMFL